LDNQTLKEIFYNVKLNQPLVHNITNYVTANDCANLLLACGASPIMADDILEAEEITSISSSLVMNIGTLHERTVEAMIAAGKKSNELGHPVILDPVGAGASEFRTDTIIRLLNEVSFAVISGNMSEIRAVSGNCKSTKGVDADASHAVTEDNLKEMIEFAAKLSQRTGAVIVITGAIDIIADTKIAFISRNGHPMMSKVTGTGCMLSAAIGAFCAANPLNIAEAAAAAVCMLGLCGEMAYRKVLDTDGGTASFKLHFMDYVSKIDAEMLQSGAKLEVIDFT
jgi:hydroxyethylthiazole kinase